MPATHTQKCAACGRIFEADEVDSGISLCADCSHLTHSVLPQPIPPESQAGDATTDSAPREWAPATQHGDDATVDSGFTIKTDEREETIAKNRQSIGRFQLRRNLGFGAFGRVYLAHDPLLDREVALKVPRFPPDEPDLVERFLREAKAAARLRHPNIVTTFECGRFEQDYYIATEFVDGMTLSKKISDGDFDQRQAALWVRDLADALTYAHSENIIHRDIKPGNIMLSHAGRPQLMDFGLAKIQTDDEGMTIDGSVVGTPAYMAPEQARGDIKATGPQADQYSLGAVLYELLTKQKPFTGSMHSIIMRVAGDDEPAPIRKFVPDIPADLEAICEKALSKHPNNRYPSTAEFAQDIESWIAGEPIQARRISQIERTWRWCRRNRAVASLLFLIASMLILGATASAIAAINFRSLAQRDRESANRAREKELEAARLAVDAELRLADMFTFTGLAAAREGDPAQAVLWFANAVGRSGADPLRENANRVRFNAWSGATPMPAQVIEHPGKWIKQMDFDPSGRYLLTLWYDEPLQLWDISGGHRVVQEQFRRQIISAAWSPDGQWLATGSEAGIEITQVSDWIVLAQEELPGGVQRLVFSDDGQWLAVAVSEGDAHSLRLWNCRDRKFAAAMIALPAPAKRLSFAAGSQLLAVACADDFARVYPVSPPGENGEAAIVAIPNVGPIQKTSPRTPLFINDDSTLLTFSQHRPEFLRWSNLADGKEAAQFSISTEESQTYLNLFAVSPDRRFMVLGSGIGATAWEIGTQSRVGKLMPHTNTMTSVAFHKDGEILLTGSLDRTARLWEFPSGEPLSPSIKHEDEVRFVAYSPDPHTFATCQRNGVVKLWRFRPMSSRHLQRPIGWYDAFLRGSADGRFVAPATWNSVRSSRVVHVIDTSTGEDVGGHLQAAGILNAAALSADGSQVMALSSELTEPNAANASQRKDLMCNQPGWIELFDRASGQQLTKPIATPSEPIAGAFHPTRPLAGVLCAAGQVLFVDTELGELQQTLMHGGKLRTGFMIRGYLRFTNDGSSLVTWGLGDQVKVWDVANLQERFHLIAGPWTSDVIFSKDSRRMVLCGSGSEVRIVDLATGADAVSPLAHPDWVFTASFSPDETLLVTAGRDKTARVWDLRSGLVAAPDLEHDDEVFDVAFANDGDWVLTTCRDGSVHFWDQHSGKPLAPPVQLDKLLSYSLVLGPDRQSAVISGKDSVYLLNLHSILDDPSLDLDTRVMLGELIAGRRLLPEGGVVTLKSSEWRERWQTLLDGGVLRDLLEVDLPSPQPDPID